MSRQTIDITPNELSMVLDVLKIALPKDSKVWVFGSRAKHTTRHNSDLDLAIDTGKPLDSKTRMALQTGFEDAHLPYTVDTVDMQTVEPYFKEIIDQQKKPLPGWGNVPELRFPEFEGEWEVKGLGDIAKVIDCKHRTPPYIEEGIPVVSPGSIKWGSLDLESPVKRVSATEYESLMDHCEPKVGDLVFSRNQSLGIASYVSTVRPFVLGQDTVLIQSDRYSGVIYYWLQRQNIQNYITSLSGGSTFSRINLSDIRRLNIKIPNAGNEQQKIADFLYSFDAKLAKLYRKKALLEDYKRGLMQQIFSQKIRFKQDDGSEFPEWDYVELGEILEYEQPTKYLVSSTEYDDSYHVPVLTAGKTFILGYTNETHGVYEPKNEVIIFDDFTTASKFVDFRFKAKSSAMKILKPKDKHTSLRVIYEFMQLLKFPIGEHKRYWISEFQCFEIPTPCFAEQQKIADFLSSIDQKIDFVAKQIKQLEVFKKGLLQKLFV